jgi:hypothetical protein
MWAASALVDDLVPVAPGVPGPAWSKHAQLEFVPTLVFCWKREVMLVGVPSVVLPASP